MRLLYVTVSYGHRVFYVPCNCSATRTYAFFAVGSQSESRWAETLVGSLSIDASSLASAVVNCTLVHIYYFSRVKKKKKQIRDRDNQHLLGDGGRWAMNKNLLNIYIFIHRRGFNFLLAPYGPNFVDFYLYGRRRRKKKKTEENNKRRSTSIHLSVWMYCGIV